MRHRTDSREDTGNFLFRFTAGGELTRQDGRRGRRQDRTGQGRARGGLHRSGYCLGITRVLDLDHDIDHGRLVLDGALRGEPGQYHGAFRLAAGRVAFAIAGQGFGSSLDTALEHIASHIRVPEGGRPDIMNKGGQRVALRIGEPGRHNLVNRRFRLHHIIDQKERGIIA